MTQAATNQQEFVADGDPVRVVALPEELRLHGAARLVDDPSLDPMIGGARMLDAARRLGLDLSLMFGTLADGEPNPLGSLKLHAKPRQVCLAVPAPGRTATLFVSSTATPVRLASAPRSPGQDRAERAMVIEAACRFLAKPGKRTGQGVALAQALLSIGEHAAVDAFGQAGFSRLGDLAYLRRHLGKKVPDSASAKGGIGAALPPGISARALPEIDRAARTPALLRALELSYELTLDCPELSGLREPTDVLESHVAVGRHDPSLWWVIYDQAEPAGCMLLTTCPDQETVELVYLGLGRSLRGRGIGRIMLDRGLAALSGRKERTVTCAVDTRNAPALRLYERAGFENFATRIPMVRSLRSLSDLPNLAGV
ncbi:MAG: GNAT family N-acetyltransferase [Phycisphaerales bacterium]|nr:GNAT family N-acetyltransferase [Phycisphaerales bacterium]